MDAGRRPNPSKNARLLFLLLDVDEEGCIPDLEDAFDVLKANGISAELEAMLASVIQEVIDVCGSREDITEEEFVEAARGCQCLWLPSPESQRRFDYRFRPNTDVTEPFDKRLKTDQLRRWCHRNDLEEAAFEEEMHECTFWPETTVRPRYLPRTKFVSSFERLTRPRKPHGDNYLASDPTGLRLVTTTHEKFADMLRTYKTRATKPSIRPGDPKLLKAPKLRRSAHRLTTSHAL
ncbi:hypothetical protein FOL47_007764 [Perkinsus chesapeaki]|uniref:Uncharacterized protein n=1 Tax=Perkinsus chesapeaki TaxID=330153 RepID=A0A7J6LI94_PERCH|nr:hypothetical protein FOL47_007764 [Perkinsus chesapeaki]